MMISTVLLIINCLFLFFKGNAIINWWLFLIFYPAEIIIWLIIGISWIKIIYKLFD